MTRSSSSKLRWLLVVVLAAWVVGLFFTSTATWLRPFASGAGEILGKEIRVPGADRRPGRAGIARIDLDDGKSRLLVIRAAAGDAFSLQIKDGVTGDVARLSRFPARDEAMDVLVPLDPRKLPRRLRLTLWNRSRSDLVIEQVTIGQLRSGYRLLRGIYLAAGPLLLILVAGANRGKWGLYLEGADVVGVEQWPRWDGTVAATLFLVCFTVFRWAPVHQLLDSKFITVVSHSLIHSGSVALPENFQPARRAREIYTLKPVGEKTYHFFSSAPAVLNAPIVGVFEAFGVRPVGDDGDYWGHNERKILRFSAAMLAALLCVLLFWTARIWLPPGYALLVVLVFAFGSQIFSTISRPFWSHAWTTVLLAGALYLLVSPRLRDRGWSYVAISTLLCWAYFCRPPMSLAVIGVTLYVAFARRRVLGRFLVTGLFWAGLFAVYALQTYGTILPPYFFSSHVQSGRLAGGLLLTSYPEAMVGTLVSPGRGLLVYVPILLLVLILLVRYWRYLPDKPLAVTALGVCVAHWQLVSVFRNWWGGQSFGPRLMSDLVPWFVLLAVLALAAVRDAQKAGAFDWTRAKTGAVLLLVAASVFINTRGAISQETQRGAGIWNWRYPQFMAGLIPRPDIRDEGQTD